MSKKKLGFGLMRLPLLDPNDDGSRPPRRDSGRPPRRDNDRRGGNRR